MRRREANRTTELGWRVVLVAVGILFVCVLASQQFRFRIGGKWSVPFVGAALLVVIYLQPAVQRWVRKRNKERREEAERRWWRERDRRERQALLRTEKLRQEKARKNRQP